MKCTRCFHRDPLPNRKMCAYCTEKGRQKVARWNKNHPTYAKNHAQNMRKQLRLEAVEKYGGACVCCNQTYEPFLEFDHANGGGNIERKQKRHGIPWYRYLVTSAMRPDIQLLCGNCHNAKNRHLPCLPGHSK